MRVTCRGTQGTALTRAWNVSIKKSPVLSTVPILIFLFLFERSYLRPPTS